ncbi:hypothetical protein ACG2LH_09745 [Zhouia sp. PK063]|uniref:hypothetical protein n=1 Tax=Zhouia sp. PK063 TaxID=3373602 RepID=UPI0037A8829C
MKKVHYIFFLLIIVSCSKSDPKPPEQAILLTPENNAECVTGTDNGSTQKNITFTWQEAKYTDVYVLTITNLNTNANTTYSTKETSLNVILNKAVPYSWKITTQNDAVADITESETRKFYVAGNAITNYAPFPADLLSPSSGAVIVATQTTLQWSGSDIENDITSYKIFLDVQPDPVNVIVENTTATSVNVSGFTSGIYYWKVVTTDSENNTSVSPIYSFKIIE